jgi:hypothetical protein
VTDRRRRDAGRTRSDPYLVNAKVPDAGIEHRAEDAVAVADHPLNRDVRSDRLDDPLDQPLEVTWSADPNSETMSIQVLDTDTGAVVACRVADGQQSVTIDASLFASIAAGDRCQTAADRETDRYVQTSTGRVELSTFGWASVLCSIQ